MKKIIISTIVIGLLLMTSIASANAFDMKAESIEFGWIPFAYIYVDDNNTEGPWDGTVEHPYQFIQDGIDNASDGDIVYVSSGIYYENIEIDKSIFLRGEDRDSTIIDGGRIESVIKITVDCVTISGFTTRKSKTAWPGSGIYIEASNYNIISGNTMSENGGGIDLSYSSSNNTISDNIISNNCHGMSLYNDCDSNTISDNIISNNYDGICLYLSNNNSFCCNIITSNKLHGIRHESSDNSIISGNIICSNNEFGLILVDSNYCLVSNNTINSNNYSGLFNWVSSGNNISDNIVNSNKGSGIRLQTGNDVLVCAYNIISSNNVSNNDIGIILRGAHTNTVSANTISDNNEYGIVLEIEIDMWGNLLYCYDNIIYHNNLINNGQQAYDTCTNNNPSEDCTNLWYNSTLEEGNYWDDYEGWDLFPRDGIGDTPYDVPGPGGDIQDRYPLMKPYDGSTNNNQNSQSSQQQSQGSSSRQSLGSSGSQQSSSQQFTTTSSSQTFQSVVKITNR